MRFHASVHTDATDPVSFAPSIDGHNTILRTGDDPNAYGLFINGTEAQRADFLRRLAAAASDAADGLVPRVEVVGVPALAKFGEWSGGAL